MAQAAFCTFVLNRKTLSSGVDFLGWVHFPDHRVLRTATKQRMLKRIAGKPSDASVESYRGMLRHGNARKFAELVLGAIQSS